MKHNKLKLFLAVIFIFILMVLVKQNVSAKKEPIAMDSTIKNLEVTSEIVQELYSKLTLLSSDGIVDNNYRDLYFDFEGSEKVISEEDMLFIAFDSLYRSDLLEKVKETDSTFKTDIQAVDSEIKMLFRNDTFVPAEVSLKPSLDCGIVNYLYTGTSYELGIVSCNQENRLIKTELESAIKEGNYIKLKIKAFEALMSDSTETGKSNYKIKNFATDDILTEISVTDAKADFDEIFTRDDIDDYTFVFELRGDDYFLDRIYRS